MEYAQSQPVHQNVDPILSGLSMPRLQFPYRVSYRKSASAPYGVTTEVISDLSC
jgi:hypothetical protein